ncbi:unnamed protein product [Paramecium primaurelia]|uniref:Uncharacterized protein n=1 Tax=Paramecium primaurelia TaxID=5886 RepID=A0A8S1KV14_PARPR|nr:unnamed protein product [Paramecium primaurelia]
MTQEQCDSVFKFIIIGNRNCGKSSLLYHYIHGFSAKIVQLNKKIKMQSCDTAGQERYRFKQRLLLRSIRSLNTQNLLKLCKNGQSMQETSQTFHSDYCFWKESRFRQGEQTAKLFCQENDVQYIKTSAATEYQVNDAFKQIKTRFLNLLQKGSIDGNIIKPKFLTSKKSDLTQQCNC